MINEKALEAVLRPSDKQVTPLTRKYEPLLPCMFELYDLGLTIKQLGQIFPVSKKWLRVRFKAAKKKMRPAHARKGTDALIDQKNVMRILKKHSVSKHDLRAPIGTVKVPKGEGGRPPMKRAKNRKAKTKR